MPPRVAIVAAEVRTALGDEAPGADLDATCLAIRAGRSALRSVRGFDASGFSERGAPVLAAQLPDEPDAGETEGGARVLGPHGRVLAGVAAAVHRAARGTEIPREDLGLYVATGMVDSPVEDLAPALLASRRGDGGFDLAAFFESGFRAIHPLWPLSTLNNVPVGQIAVDLDVRGDHLVLGPEADAGGRAIAEAFDAIRSGVVRAAIAAGVGERVSPASLARRRARGLPASGLGEGGGALFLESEASARERGVRPLAFVSSVECSFGPRPGPRAEAPYGDLLAGRAVVEVAVMLRTTGGGATRLAVGGSSGGAVSIVLEPA